MNLRSTSATLTLLLPVFALMLAFQNCAPGLPVEEGSSLNASNTRPTATPPGTTGPFASPTPGGSPAPANGWEGTCVSKSTEDLMAWQGNDALPGVNTAFVNGEKAAIWYHTSNSFNSARVCSMHGAGWSLKGVANVDGIGPSDMIWRNVDGRIAVWRMYGSNRQFGAILPNTVASDWKLEGAPDLDGDSREDLVFRHLDGRIQVWLMNGTQVSAINDIGTVPSNWKLRGVGDFDGDNKDDLLYREVTGPMEIWFMNGQTVKIKKSVVNTGPNPNPTHGIKASADFDGDGRADLVFLNGAGEFFFWKMNGEVGTLDPRIYTPMTKLIHGSVDANFDGISDIILTGNSWLYVWEMRGMVPYNNTIKQIQAGWSIFAFDKY